MKRLAHVECHNSNVFFRIPYPNFNFKLPSGILHAIYTDAYLQMEVFAFEPTLKFNCVRQFSMAM